MVYSSRNRIMMYGCDKSTMRGRCNRRPYIEVYHISSIPSPYGNNSSWSYLCFFHFVIDFVMNKVTRSGRGYCYVSYERTLLKRLRDKKDYSEED